MLTQYGEWQDGVDQFKRMSQAGTRLTEEVGTQFGSEVVAQLPISQAAGSQDAEPRGQRAVDRVHRIISQLKQRRSKEPDGIISAVWRDRSQGESYPLNALSPHVSKAPPVDTEIAANVPGMDLRGLCVTLGLPVAYADTLHAQELRMEHVLSSDTQFLQTAGVTKLGHCLQLRAAVVDLATQLLRLSEAQMEATRKRNAS